MRGVAVSDWTAAAKAAFMSTARPVVWDARRSLHWPPARVGAGELRIACCCSLIWPVRSCCCCRCCFGLCAHVAACTGTIKVHAAILNRVTVAPHVILVPSGTGVFRQALTFTNGHTHRVDYTIQHKPGVTISMAGKCACQEMMRMHACVHACTASIKLQL